MDATTALNGLMTAIDEHRWPDLAQYLHPDFTCRLVHTGESFGRDEWIRFNAEYPGFDRLRVEELVGTADQAACRSHVTGQGDNGLDHFECASFVRMQEGLIQELTEVWTDVAQKAPPGTRPAMAGDGAADVNADEGAAGEEVRRLHRIIESWLSGRTPRDESGFGEFQDAHAPGFMLVGPDGAVLDRDRVLDMVRSAHGAEPGIKIDIHDVSLVAADRSVVVAAYREEHSGSNPARSRWATVVFTRDEDAPHGLRWRRLQETWAPEVS